MTSWENPVPVAAFFSSTDLENRSPRDSQVPPLIDDARSRSYDAVCIPLTTAKWMERWRGMCVISSEPDERPEGSELRAETWRANPVFQLGEVTMTCLGMSLLRGAGLHVLMWSHGSEEAGGVIVMVSDWLELDAADSWVRHDSEIVSVLRRHRLLNPHHHHEYLWLGVTLPGPTAGAFLRVILGCANRNLPTPSQSQSDCGLWTCRQRLSCADPLHAIFHPTSHL
jgi:hypothetical protein